MKNNANSSYYSELKSENTDLKNENSILNQEIETLKHNIGIFQRALFGKKSEKLNPEDLEQLRLVFNGKRPIICPTGFYQYYKAEARLFHHQL